MMNNSILSILIFLTLLLSSCLSDNKGQKQANEERHKIPPTFSASTKLYGLKNSSNEAMPTLASALTHEGLPANYRLETYPSHGVLSQCLGLDGTDTNDLNCLFTPETNYAGEDSFNYSAIDKFSNKTIATVPITIFASTAPTFSAQEIISITEGTTNNILPTLKSASITTPSQNDPLYYSLVTLPVNGTLKDCLGLNQTTNTDLDCTYTPNNNFHGTDSFTYKAMNRYGDNTTNTVTLNILSTNKNPSVSPTIISVIVKKNATTAQSIDITPNSVSDLDLDNSTLYYEIVTMPSLGKLTSCLNLAGAQINPDTTCLYWPPLGIEGLEADSFVYKIKDKQDAYVLVSVTIDILNNIPVATDQNINNVSEDIPYNFNLDISDSDGTSDILSLKGLTPLNGFSLFSGVIEGVGTISNCMGLNSSALTDSSCTFTPATNFVGTGSFTYKITDTSLDTDTATVTFTINETGDAPDLSNQSFNFTENAGAKVFSLTPPTDIDINDTFSYRALTNPTQGTLSSCFSSGSLTCTYTPNSNINGVDSFTVQVTDSFGLTDTATITLNITSSNHYPVISDQTFSFTENDPLTPITITPATDADSSDSLIYTITTASAALTNCMNSDADLICDYTPAANVHGTPADFVVFQVNDQQGGISTARLFFNITSTNSAPNAAADETVNIYNKYGTQAFALTGTTDPDATDTLKYSLKTPPKKGVLSDCLALNSSTNTDLNCNYSITGTKEVNLTSFDTFFYTVTDNEGASQDIKVTITTQTYDEHPVIVSHEFTNKTIIVDENISNINVYLDEGGDSSEDDQILEVCVSSTNLNLIPQANISLSYNGTILTNDCTAMADIDSALISADSSPLIVGIVPATGLSGVSDLTFRMQQTVMGTTTQKTVNFKVTVVSPSITFIHRGWTNVKATGFKAYLNSTGTMIVEENPRVELSWQNFGNPIATTDTVAKYRIYRTDRTPQNYEYIAEVTDPSYVDTAVSNSWPTSTTDPTNGIGKALWYKIMPVTQNGIIGKTDEAFNVVRVLVPPPNKVFIHRWIANLLICSQLGSGSVLANNYACPYIGPGNSLVAAEEVYDFGHDLIMDRYEAGCPYTKGIAGIGSGAPDVSLGADDDVYYAKSSGICYQKVAGTWGTYYAATSSIWNNLPYLPPLTNVSQEQAHSICANFSTTIKSQNTLGTLAVDTWNDLAAAATGRLMSRKEYMVGSYWNLSLSDSSINTIEANSCNSQKWTDTTFNNAITSDKFPSATNNYIYRTASSATQNCTSIFGAQDLVGNVSEWSTDRILCQQDYECEAISTATNAGSKLAGIGSAGDWLFENGGSNDYDFLGSGFGPCLDTNADGACDNSPPWSSWSYSAMTNDAINIYLPTGLPAVQNASGNFMTITNNTAKLHSDEIVMNATNINAGSDIGALGLGSSFNHEIGEGSKAGVYTLEFYEKDYTSSQVGFRCVNEFAAQ